MNKIAIIGGGISGLSIAHQLSSHGEIVVFEKEDKPGGLIKCDFINGNLFHTCGGHVFNSKRQDVLDFFWNYFNRENEFVKTDRNSIVHFSNNQEVPYPVENHIYYFDNMIVDNVIKDIVSIIKKEQRSKNFKEFLINQFGLTLYNLYFRPYNEKIWKCDLSDVSLSWLKGKLPTPTPQEIIYNNIKKIKEKQFVHSSFWYSKKNGSQFIADRMAKNVNIKYTTIIDYIKRDNGRWNVNGEDFDIVVFCGNIKDLPFMIKNFHNVESYYDSIDRLKYHGTTSVFCEIDKNPFSWIYLPNKQYDAHRIICTGNFSPYNNDPNLYRITGTIEFTDSINEEEIIRQLKDIPFNPTFIAKKYNRYTYPIQDDSTRKMLKEFKNILCKEKFFMVGRFADWEYYNMDVAMGAAIDLSKSILEVLKN